MSNVVSSVIFCAKNVDKAENQDKVGRWAVAVGQAKKIFDYVSELDNTIGDDAKAASEALKDFSKNKPVVKYAEKAVNFASKNVNPLICLSSGIDVLNAKDKETAAITNVAALSTMFAVENQMKKHLDDIPKLKVVQKYFEKFKHSEVGRKVINDVEKYAKNNKWTKGVPALIHGTAFVVGSCTAYNIGDKFGTLVAPKITGRETPVGKS